MPRTLDNTIDGLSYLRDHSDPHDYDILTARLPNVIHWEELEITGKIRDHLRIIENPEWNRFFGRTPRDIQSVHNYVMKKWQQTGYDRTTTRIYQHAERFCFHKYDAGILHSNQIRPNKIKTHRFRQANKIVAIRDIANHSNIYILDGNHRAIALSITDLLDGWPLILGTGDMSDCPWVGK